MPTGMVAFMMPFTLGKRTTVAPKNIASSKGSKFSRLHSPRPKRFHVSTSFPWIWTAWLASPQLLVPSRLKEDPQVPNLSQGAQDTTSTTPAHRPPQPALQPLSVAWTVLLTPHQSPSTIHFCLSPHAHQFFHRFQSLSHS